MTVGELIESLLLRVTGGNLNADNDVRREDIRVLVGPATSFVLAQYSQEQLRTQLQLSRLNGSGMYTGSHSYSTTYKLTPILDEDRGLYYITPPGNILRLPQESGIDMVRPVTGRKSYIGVKSDAEISGIPVAVDAVFYWIEVLDDQTRVYMDNVGRPVCDHYLRAILDPNDLSSSDEFPVPAGVDMRVIDILVAHFEGQRLFPQDYRIDDRDNAKIQN